MSEAVKQILSKEEFDEIAAKETRPVLVDFWATWCGPCKMQGPVFHAFAEEMKEKVCALSVDVDECGELAALLEIRAIPTILVVKNNEEKERNVGLCTEKDLANMVIKYL